MGQKYQLQPTAIHELLKKKKTVRTGITLTKLKGYSEAIELISWRSTGNQLEVDVAKLIPASGLDAPTPGGP